MSLCFALMSNKYIIMTGDSRESILVDGQYYATGNYVSKIRQVGNKVIFMGGSAEVTTGIISEFSRSNDQSIENLQKLTLKHRDNFIERYGPDYLGGTAHAVFLIGYFDNGLPVICGINSKNDCEIVKQFGDEAPLQTAIVGPGEVRDIAYSLYLENRKRNKNVVEVLLDVYNTVSNEEIGGDMTVYTITKSSIDQKMYPIKDNRNIKTLSENVHCNNADEFKMQVGDGEGNYEDAVYFDPIAGVYKFNGTLEAADGVFTGTLKAGRVEGSEIIGGSITSDTDINITRDIRVGNNIFLGLGNPTNDRRIEFVDSGQYRSYIGFTNSTKQLDLYAANDIQINSGLNVSIRADYDVLINADRVIIPFNTYLGSASSSNRLLVQSDLGGKANVEDAGYNLSFDPNTRNLKMYNRYGDLMAQVTIPR